MEPRHIDCRNSRCAICLEDCRQLERILDERNNDNNKHDLLGKYHKWLADNNIPNETEWGWFSKEAFEEKNVNDFCKYFRTRRKNRNLERNS